MNQGWYLPLYRVESLQNDLLWCIQQGSFESAQSSRFGSDQRGATRRRASLHFSLILPSIIVILIFKVCTRPIWFVHQRGHRHVKYGSRCTRGSGRTFKYLLFLWPVCGETVDFSFSFGSRWALLSTTAVQMTSVRQVAAKWPRTYLHISRLLYSLFFTVFYLPWICIRHGAIYSSDDDNNNEYLIMQIWSIYFK